jgi:hypothetical protein
MRPVFQAHPFRNRSGANIPNAGSISRISGAILSEESIHGQRIDEDI